MPRRTDGRECKRTHARTSERVKATSTSACALSANLRIAPTYQFTFDAGWRARSRFRDFRELGREQLRFLHAGGDDGARETRQLAWPPKQQVFCTEKPCGGGGGDDLWLFREIRNSRAEIFNAFSRRRSTRGVHKKCDRLSKNYASFPTGQEVLYLRKTVFF